jgi:integrase
VATYSLSEKNVAQWLAQSQREGKNRLYYDDHKDAPRGFALRVTKGGAAAFVLNYYVDGVERRATIGPFGRLPGQLSITAARKRAAAVRDKINAGGDPLAEKEKARAERAKSKAEAVRKRGFTLASLLDAYAEYLRASGRVSWREVRAAFNRHVIENPKRAVLSARPADEVTSDDVMHVLDPLTNAGKVREAEKLRSYMRSAYTLARKAEKKTGAALSVFRGFHITTNPVADIEIDRPRESVAASAEAAKARKWSLSEAQLACYWRRIAPDTSPRGALLRLHLLTGAQRVEQLSRVTVHDLDGEQATITLRDTKGRRRVAYEHVLPLLPEALDAIEAMRGDSGPHLFSVSSGQAPASYHLVWGAVQEVSDAMVAAKEIDRGFSPGVLRKTVETRLAAAGVPYEVRAHLQSHGLGGVVFRHYNAHDYLSEMRGALQKLRAMCEPKGKPGNVAHIRRA